MRFLVLASIFVAFLLLNLCSCASVKLPNSETASEQFSRLSSGQKSIAKNFYELGQGDAIKRLYWAQRDAQQSRGLSDAPPPVNLQRKYINVWIPPETDVDGTQKEGHFTAVEVVQFWEVVPSKKGRLWLCR
jgi:hypothetical protein